MPRGGPWGPVPLLRSPGDLLKLEDAVRYPGAARKVIPILVIGAAAMGLFFVVTLNPWGSAFVGVICWFVGALLVVGRDNRVLELATRIFDERPELTAEEAANAARTELGLPAVRYP